MNLSFPRVIRSVFLSVVLASAAWLPLAHAGGEETQNNVAVVKRFLNEVVNNRHFERVDQLWTKDMVWYGASLGEIHGIDAYRKILEASVDGSFTGMKLNIRDIVASGDKVVVYFTNSGHNTGEFMGKPATGKYAIWEGMGIYQVAGGKIARAWFVEDIFGQQKMLGNSPVSVR